MHINAKADFTNMLTIPRSEKLRKYPCNIRTIALERSVVKLTWVLNAFIKLHQHTFCVYKGNRKLKLPIPCENFERVGRVTVNTAFFSP